MERSRKLQRTASSVGATLPSMKLISTTPKKSKFKCRNRSVSLPSRVISLFDNGQNNFLLVECTAEAHFEIEVSMDLVSNLRKPTELRFSPLTIKNSFVTALLQAAVILAHHDAHSFRSMRVVKRLQRIGWDRAAFDFVQVIFPE